MRFANGTPCPDNIYKQIYAAVGNKIELVDTIAGVHKPSFVVPDSYEFP